MTSLRWETHGDEWKKARRERIAITAMQAILTGWYSDPTATGISPDVTAREAVKTADALIAELDKEAK